MLFNLLKIGSLLGALAIPFTQNDIASRPETMEAPAKQGLYDFKVKSLEGKNVDLSMYKGKKVINVDLHHNMQIGKNSI